MLNIIFSVFQWLNGAKKVKKKMNEKRNNKINNWKLSVEKRGVNKSIKWKTTKKIPLVSCSQFCSFHILVATFNPHHLCHCVTLETVFFFSLPIYYSIFIVAFFHIIVFLFFYFFCVCFSFMLYDYFKQFYFSFSFVVSLLCLICFSFCQCTIMSWTLHEGHK